MKDVEDMTVEELREEVRRLRSEDAVRARYPMRTYMPGPGGRLVPVDQEPA